MATSPNLAFQRNLAFGQMAESRIARWLRARGNLILPVYEIEYDSGKGPRLAKADGMLIAPDLLVFKSELVFWCECKRKTVFSWHRNSKPPTWVTGIDLRHYEDYLRVADSTLHPVWLLFLHESGRTWAEDLHNGAPPCCPTGLFGNDLAFLRKNENHRHSNWGKSGMVYWAIASLKKLANLEDL